MKNSCEHVEDEVLPIGMYEAGSEQAVWLAAALHTARPQDKVADDSLIIECTQRNKHGNQDKRYSKGAENHYWLKIRWKLWTLAGSGSC